MLLKSDGFAPNLADPASAFRSSISVTTPIRLETFRMYGLAFQHRVVPEAEDTEVIRIDRAAAGFRLDLGDGRHATAQNVVLAIGISHFHVVPPALRHLPLGSAIDLAVVLAEAKANVVLVARGPSLRFNDPPMAHRPSASSPSPRFDDRTKQCPGSA